MTKTIDNNVTFARQGWECPKCGAVLSPDTAFCPFCTPVINNTVWTDSDTAGSPKQWLSKTVSSVKIKKD